MKASRIGLTVCAAGMVIALASCSGGNGSDPVSPAVQPDQSQAGVTQAPVVTRRDFQIEYRLEGFTATSDGVRLISNPRLDIDPQVADGSEVSAGDPIGSIIVNPDVRALLEVGSQSSALDADRLGQLESMESSSLSSPISGMFDASQNTIMHEGLDVVVQLTPIQSLRYQSLIFDGEASVETIVGDRLVACQAVWLALSSPATSETDGDVQPVGSGSDELHCRLSAAVETAPGIRALLTLRSETLTDAIVVPNRSVGYDETTDSYYVNLAETNDGVSNVVRYDVSVGVTDGVVRVITSPLDVGAELVQIEAD